MFREFHWFCILDVFLSPRVRSLLVSTLNAELPFLKFLRMWEVLPLLCSCDSYLGKAIAENPEVTKMSGNRTSLSCHKDFVG